MANEKVLPSNDTLLNGKPHDANLIRDNDEYLRDTIYVDSSEPLGPNVHRGMIWIDTSVTPHAIKIRLVSSWATVTTVDKLLYGNDANKGATPDPGDFYIATDTGKIYVCFTDDSWEMIYSPVFPEGAYYNILTNGGFEIWQRGIGPFTSSEYTADLWKLDHVGAITSKQVDKETTIVKNGISSLKCNWVKGSGNYVFIHQEIENYIEYRNTIITFSCWIKCSAISHIELKIYDGIGATSSSKNSGTDWELLTVTRTIDSSATNIDIEIIDDVGDSTFYIDSAMVVVGDKAIDYIPLNLTDDLNRCQRYYEIFGSFAWVGYHFSTNDGFLPTQFKIIKKSTPTITINTTSKFPAAMGNLIAYNISVYGFSLQAPTDGVTGGHVYNSTGWTAEIT